VEDVDAVFKEAVAAGAQVRMPLDDMFWGDRYGKVVDPFGHEWSLATHKEDLTPEEISERAQAFAFFLRSAGPVVDFALFRTTIQRETEPGFIYGRDRPGPGSEPQN